MIRSDEFLRFEIRWTLRNNGHATLRFRIGLGTLVVIVKQGDYRFARAIPSTRWGDMLRTIKFAKNSMRTYCCVAWLGQAYSGNVMIAMRIYGPTIENDLCTCREAGHVIITKLMYAMSLIPWKSGVFSFRHCENHVAWSYACMIFFSYKKRSLFA
jgi:hypothetical protein